MTLTIREANAASRLIRWAQGHRLTESLVLVTDEDATEAARLLAAAVNKSLHAGPRPDSVTLRWTRTLGERLRQLLDSQLLEDGGEDEARAVLVVLDALDRIDRQAAEVAGQEQR